MFKQIALHAEMRKDVVCKVVMSLNESTLQGVVVRQEKDQRPAANMLERCVMLLRSSVDQVDSQSS